MTQKLLTEDQDKRLRELASTGEYYYSDLQKFFPEFTLQQIQNYCMHRKIKCKKRDLWTKEELEAVTKYCEQGLSFEEMVPLLNNKWTAKNIHKYCITHKIYNTRFNFWTKEEEDLLTKLLESGMYRFRDLPQFFPKRSFGTIQQKILRMGLTTKHKNSCYVFDQDYWNVPTKNNCYYAGFLMADGCIFKEDNCSRFLLNISLRDKDLMDNFQKEIKSNHKIRHYKKKSPGSDNIYDYIFLSIGGIQKWEEPLWKYYGMRPNKTKRFPAPNLTKIEHKLAYTLGYFDGDGSVLVRKNNTLVLSVISSNRTIIEYFKDLFESFNISRLNNTWKNNEIIDRRNEGTAYLYHIGGFRACVIYELIMRTNPPFFLKRKWLKPEIIEIVNKAKSRPEWPEESFFQNILNG